MNIFNDEVSEDVPANVEGLPRDVGGGEPPIYFSGEWIYMFNNFLEVTFRAPFDLRHFHVVPVKVETVDNQLWSLYSIIFEEGYRKSPRCACPSFSVQLFHRPWLAMGYSHLIGILVYQGFLLEQRVYVVTPGYVKTDLSLWNRVGYLLLDGIDVTIFKLN